MTKKAMILSVLMLGGLASVANAAEDLKIGVVDMQRALQTVDAGKKAKAQLETEFNKKKQQLQSEEASLRKASEEFKKQSLVLNEEARTKKQAELQERFMKLQEMTGRAQSEIQQKEQELTAPLIVSIRAIIADLAKKKGMTMILEKNENTVLFSLEKDELTDEVVQIFNRQNKG